MRGRKKDRLVSGDKRKGLRLEEGPSLRVPILSVIIEGHRRPTIIAWL